MARSVGELALRGRVAGLLREGGHTVEAIAGATGLPWRAAAYRVTLLRHADPSLPAPPPRRRGEAAGPGNPGAPRTCLGCGGVFRSRVPRSKRRRCPECRRGVDCGGLDEHSAGGVHVW